MAEIWNSSIVKDLESNQKFILEIGSDVLRMAFQKHLGGNENGLMTDEAYELMESYFPKRAEAFTNYEYVKLIDVINFTDFIDISRVLRLHSQDSVHACLEEVKKEKSIV